MNRNQKLEYLTVAIAKRGMLKAQSELIVVHTKCYAVARS